MNEKEIARLESKFDVTEFPECVGFVECVRIKYFMGRKENYNFDTEELMSEERKCEIEVWINLNKYCWSWCTLPIRGSEFRNKLTEK